jgi:RNA polymerase sigma factor (sigma-70 family)
VTLDDVVRELAPRLLGYCRLETDDASLAEEIAQDTLAALVQRWRRFGAPDSPAAFVFAIARRRCARAMVRRRLLRPIEEVFGLRDGHPTPEQRAVRADEREQVTRALARLRAPDRQILLLLTVGEIGMEEAATMLGISVSAAKMRAMRARQRLRAVLESTITKPQAGGQLKEGNGHELG